MNKYKDKLFLLIFTVLLILPVLSFFHAGIPLTHDGGDHVARIANFYQNITEGNLIPRWAGNLNWGYGHPILEFLYPLSSYIASLLHLLGISLVSSTVLVFILGMTLSFVFMYLWLSRFLSKSAALFGAVLYTYAPYRFVEIYVRGDIGENLAFAFIPLVLYFIYKLYKENTFLNAILGGISLSLLILSHNAISLMFMPFIVVYGVILLQKIKSKKSFIISLILLLGVGLALSAFFWIPGLLEGKYTLRNIVTKGVYVNGFVTFARLIYGPWNYGITGQFTVQLGIFQWIALIASPFLIYKYRVKKDKDYIFIFFLLIFTLISIFLMLPVSDFIWSRIILLQNFQFPWRFLAISVFTTAVLGAFLAENISKKFNITLTTVAIMLILFISSFYWSAGGYIQKPQSFYTGIYNSTTDTGESAPIWSVRFMEHRPKAPLEVIDGKADIKSLERTSTYHKYLVNVEKRTLFRENTLYFPGWKILANGTPLSIEFQNRDYRGVMTFFLDKGKYTIEVLYKETKLRAVSDLISLLALFGIGIFLIFQFVKRKIN
ncbi:MAG: hypothetical protein UR81_C0033G0006 [Candidatus Levybacteria bacterium GW2011_GWB1_35_5]|nr:MAG: hypothetical protein UR81_C0033G0006 [Candidatus Levybacteria bacterium GW2011_GWB1_35_5]